MLLTSIILLLVMKKEKELLSVREAAEILDVVRQRVLQLIYADRLKAEKVGNQYVIKLSDLDAVRDRPTGRPSKDETTQAKAK